MTAADVRVDDVVRELRRASDPVGALIEAIPGLRRHLARDGALHAALGAFAREQLVARFGEGAGEGERSFAPFGTLRFPFRRMGAVDSSNLFDLDELIIFAFYRANRGLYRRAADVGANLGLHSMVLDRCGLEVRCFEPDPDHLAALRANLAANGCARVAPSPCAVSDVADRREFVRVLGNTTGSHLSGAKASPYGPLERFPVDVVPIGPILAWADLLKIDAEGEEARILGATSPEQWARADALVEVGSADNARAIWRHFAGGPVRLFAQKLGWARVESEDGVPTSYREGTLFVTRKDDMPWGSA